MSLTYTPQPEIGKPCPDFQLRDVFDKVHKLNDIQAAGLCLMFICNHCPYVKAIEDRLIALARSYDKNQIQFLAVCSNDSEDYPEDSSENLKTRALEKSYPFPYLLDEDQSFAKRIGAVCTPDLFLFDGERNLFYRGRLDDSWRDESKVSAQELKTAIDLLLQRSAPPTTVTPAMGCSIKWKY